MTDEELIKRMRSQIGDDVQCIYDHEALFRITADRIEQLVATNEALVREKAAAYAQGYGDCEAEISLTEIGRTNEFLHGQIAKWKARAERLEAALKWQAEQPEAHPFMVARAALDLKGN